ncbi:MAG: hypothetical protein QF554_11280 [Dehalococcoidia bacterium]|jgi:hypothetical protein|nr:hypothetical protein [Dehalococcoidia bacterium]
MTDSGVAYRSNPRFNPDNVSIKFGTGGDSSLYYDGADLVMSPADVGTGDLKLSGAGLKLDSSEMIDFGSGDVSLTHAAGQLTVAGDFLSSNANGPALIDEASAADNPTLLPNKSDTGTGWGNSGNDIVRGIIAGVNVIHLASDGFKPVGTTGIALGDVNHRWGDLFIKSGGKIDFAGSDVTLLHGSNSLTLQGTGNTLALGANALTLTGDIAATGARVSHLYTTDQTTTNAETVDSSIHSKVRETMEPYGGDALAVVRDAKVIKFQHLHRLDPSDRFKLGVISESIHEPLALRAIDTPEGGTYPGVNIYGLTVVNTAALQALLRRVEALEAAA